MDLVGNEIIQKQNGWFLRNFFFLSTCWSLQIINLLLNKGSFFEEFFTLICLLVNQFLLYFSLHQFEWAVVVPFATVRHDRQLKTTLGNDTWEHLQNVVNSKRSKFTLRSIIRSSFCRNSIYLDFLWSYMQFSIFIDCNPEELFFECEGI